MNSKFGKARFGKVGRAEPLHKKVAAMISREIAAGRFQPGDRLSTEHELAQTFEVSRNVVREAIACLRSDGVVDSRQGLGAFVVQPELRQAIRIDADELQQSGNLRSLFELRSLLEIEAAALAVERCSKKQLSAISDALERMTGAEKESEAGIDADLEFHRALAAATGNQYLVTFVTYLAHQMREAIVEITIDEHQRIHDAICAGDAVQAREAMRAHIRGAAGRLGIEL